jgi:hypothetical protein
VTDDWATRLGQAIQLAVIATFADRSARKMRRHEVRADWYLKQALFWTQQLKTVKTQRHVQEVPRD